MATFDINDVARRVQYTSTGQTGPFNFTFQVNASSELLVYIDDTEKTETTHYTVSLNADGTGSVTFGTATTSGELITIIGDQPLSRTTVFQVGQVNQPTTLETEFDNTLIRQQQIKEITDRSVQLKPTTGRTVTGSGTSGPLYFPYDTTVANNADRVLKFDSNGTSLELGSTTTNIDALAAIASDITTVSGISGNVTTVAGIASNVTSVASNASNINTVATNIANVNTVAGISSDVTAVAAIDTEIAALSGVSAADLSTVAGIASEITTVSGIDTEITTVSGISANVTTVAGDSTNIGTVAGISSNITTVSGISGNVTTVAGISSDVSTVAGISANVTTVAGDTTNIGTVASNISNVNTVATNISGVNSFGERYRVSSSAPTTSLDVGDLYYDTTDDIMKVYGSSGWQNAGSSVNGTSARFQYDVSSSTTTITGADKNGETLAYDAGYVDVYLNGVKMVNGTDVTVTSGTSVVFATAIGTSGTDTVDIIAYGTFSVAAISTSSITSGTLGTVRGGTGLASIGTADQVLQVNAGGTALEYGKIDGANVTDNAIGATQLNVSGSGTSGQVLASDGDGTFSWADAPSAFSYNAVSGTTPSLDLGSYNFFNQGALTGNTTVSFASVPTEHKWTYTYETAGAATSDITKLAFSGEFSTPTGYSASGLYMKPDGTVAFFSGFTGDNISAHNLSTAWDISSMSATTTNQLAHASTDNQPYGLYFKSDGTKLFVAGNQNRNVYEWTLSTAWDLTTASLTNTCNIDGIVNATADTYSGDTNGVSFKSDGTVMLICTEYRMYEYSLSTAWDTSTASYTAGSFLNLQSGGDLSTGNGSNAYNDAHFNSDGTKIFATAYDLDTIVSISLNTAYDLSSGVSSDTASTKFSSMTGSYYNAEPTVRGMHIRNDNEFYVTGNGSGGRIDKFVLISVYTLTLPSSVKEAIETTFYNHRVSLDFFTGDGGTNVHLIGQSQKRIT